LEGLRLVEDARKLTKHQLTLFFGDLHLQDIREWRVLQFSAAGYENCVFPLFKVPYTDLSNELFGPTASSFGCRYYFSAVNSTDVGFGVGDELTRPVMQKLMDSQAFDAYGENGEFHTVVRFGAL
jgi:diphthamide synthase (EF-2-diphthine--ammonia ligase)